jgi:sugar/nucleoside kinase (ribokinase family)
MSNAGGIGSITLPDASTVCIKQAIRVENQVRFVRTFDPVTKLATVDKPWCEVIAGDVDYTVFSARDGILLTEIEASEILAKEATVEAARKKAALAAALSA